MPPELNSTEESLSKARMERVQRQREAFCLWCVSRQEAPELHLSSAHYGRNWN